MSLHDVVFCIPHGATARTTRNGCLCSSNANRSMSDLHSSCTGIPDGAVHKRQEIEDLSLVASGLHDVDTELLLLCFFRQGAGRPRDVYISFPAREEQEEERMQKTTSSSDVRFIAELDIAARCCRTGPEAGAGIPLPRPRRAAGASPTPLRGLGSDL